MRFPSKYTSNGKVPMKRIFFATAASVAFLGYAATGQARLGDTVAQAADRYGAPVARATERNPNFYYEAQGFTIAVTFADPGETRIGENIAGRSKKEQFISTEQLTEDQIKALLDANLGTNQWKKTADETHGTQSCPTWRTATGDRAAYLYDNIPKHGQSLIVRWVEAPVTPKGF